MKHVHTFESFLNEANLSQPIINEAANYELKDDSGQGRPTMVLKLQPDAWDKVKNLFDDAGRPNSDEVKKLRSGEFTWDLYAADYTQGGKTMHKIYGVSGDYTFGNAPTYYQQKHRGNKKAAKEILTAFVEKYLK
jgi:hypothetical protein